MNLDYRLLKQFADVVNNPDVKDENVTLTGTARVLEDGKYVQIDGSETITPVYETVDVQEGDRVLVKIENHRAIVTGNLSYPPSARKEQEAIDKADGAQQTANQSKEDSDLAKQQAQEAQQSAKDALDKASQSEAASNEAMQAANEAQTAADNASQKADVVAGIANTANEKAQAAQDAALGAQESVSEARNEMELIRQDVTGVQSDIDGALTELGNLASEQDSIKIDMETNYAKKTDLSDVEASLKTEIDVAVGELQTTISQEYAAKSEVTEIEGKLQTQITQNAEGISQTASKVEKIESDTADAIQAVDEAKQQAQEAKAYADAAQEDANLAKAEADAATAEAEKAKERAQAAQDAATNANLAAVEADKELTEAKTALDEAKENYNNVVNKPGATAEEIARAQELVDNAQLAVNNALAKAATAIAAAKKAQEAAATAQNEAQEAQGVANTAISKADNAQTVADNALSAAQQAQEEVAELTRKVTTMETSIKQNAEAIELNANKTTEIGTKLDNLEIGGRNYVLDSNYETRIIGTYYKTYSLSDDKLNMQDSDVFVSFDAKKVAGSPSVNMYAYFRGSTPLAPDSNTIGDITESYKRYSVIIPKGADMALASHIAIHCSIANPDVYIKNIKVEKGNKATDWSPAPEDIEKELVNNYYTKTQTDAQIKVSADSIKQEVNKTVTTEISNAVNNIEIGGRNLIPNNIGYWTDGSWSIVNPGEKTSIQEYAGRISLKEFIQIDPLSEYWVKIYTSISCKILFRLLDQNQNFISSVTEMTDTLWRAPSNCYYIAITLYEPVTLDQFKNGTVKVKLEKGNKPTDWTPAPEDVTAEIDAVQVGANNLLPGTKDFSGTNNKNGTILEETYLGFPVLTKALSSSSSSYYSDVIIWYSVINVEPNTEYTLSFYAKGSGYFRSYFFPSAVYYGYSNTGATTNALDGAIDISIDSSWKKYSITWKTLPGATGLKNVLPARLFPGNTAYICAIKFEKGNKATDWSPAPEDIESSAHDYTDSSINAATSSIIESYTSLINATAKEINASVSELKTTINGQNTTIEGLTNQLEITTEMAQFVKTTTEKLEDAVSGKISESEIREWARFDGAKLELGATNSAFKAILSNTELAFYQNENKVAWISNNQLYILTAIIAKSIGCGNFTFVDEGSLGFSLI